MDSAGDAVCGVSLRARSERAVADAIGSDLLSKVIESATLDRSEYLPRL